MRRERPTLLHLHSHGLKEGLSIVVRGEEWVLSVEQLRQIFDAADLSCELLFLSACFSKEVGEGLRPYANHILCFPDAVAVAHYMPQFTELFYRELAQHGRVQTALTRAITHTQHLNPKRQDPVLLSNPNATESIWNAAEPQGARYGAIDTYLREVLPAHIADVLGERLFQSLEGLFYPPSADVCKQDVSVRKVHSGWYGNEYAPDFKIQVEVRRHREQATGEVEPNIRDRIQTLRRAVLLGEPGAGKTFLLAQIALDYKQAYGVGNGPLPVFVPLSKYSTPDDFESFVAQRLGPLAKLVPELHGTPRRRTESADHVPNEPRAVNVVWLLDALNEMPRDAGRLERLKAFLRKLAEADIPFILSCRIKNYEGDLAEVEDLYRVDLQDLNPVQIYGILARALPDFADILWQEVMHGRETNGRDLRAAWEAWEESGRNVREFWEPPSQGYRWVRDEHERARNAVHQDRRKLLLLCRNPFILSRLLLAHLCRTVDEVPSDEVIAALKQALPDNHAELFKWVITSLLTREATTPKAESVDVGRVSTMLEHTAAAMQQTEQRTEMALKDLSPHLNISAAEAMGLLRYARDANLVTLSETTVRFTHQLFQEYFATSRLRDLLKKYDVRYPGWEQGSAPPPRDERLAELFPNWWDAGGWRVTVALLGELEGETGIGRVVRWLAGYAPEIALLTVLDNNDGAQLKTLTETARTALIKGANARVTEPHPVGRAAAYRVLGHLDADHRSGVGLSADDVPDIEWGDRVPPGTYPIGGDEDVYQALSARSVELTYGYRLAKYPVTNAQFAAFVKDQDAGYNAREYWTDAGWEWKGERRSPNVSEGNFSLPNHPRVYVTWYEALAYCGWLSARYRALGLIDVGEVIGLPTEVEWEIAARGIDGRLFPYGNTFDPLKGNVRETGIGMTSAVGIFPEGVGPYGVLDQSGNVWEWCMTTYKAGSTGSNAPKGTAARVLRGGAWFNLVNVARAGARYDVAPDVASADLGFRVVLLPHRIKRI